MAQVSIFWHRRDLRLEDNAGLYYALRSAYRVQPIFIFDTEILDKLPSKYDARVEFIYDHVLRLHEELKAYGSSLRVYYGNPNKVWASILTEYDVAEVYTNRDYEPYAHARDAAVVERLREHNIPFKTYKDHVIFEKGEVLKKDGTPYTVYTPYKNRWHQKLTTKAPVGDKTADETDSFYLQSYPTLAYADRFHITEPYAVIGLEEMGFERTAIEPPSKQVAEDLIARYDQTRDTPSVMGTSRLGVHFRFGTISIRERARVARGLNETFLNELVWRDFYAQIMAEFPHVVEHPFREKYSLIEWRNDEADFKAWCEGRTGYPLVDAGMRELNATGFMHNRVRMTAASFLIKHLLIDWRWGEQYFADKLLDFDLASNNGSWQWVAGTGTDASPYFRVFNPESQQRKFDKDMRYIRHWIPEYGTDRYPEPIVEHKMARQRAIEAYKEGLGKYPG